MMSLILLAKSTISYGFYYSFKIGQFIVTTLNLLVLNLLSFINKLLALLVIVLEDFTIFLQDLLQRVNQFVALITYISDCLLLGINGTFDHCYHSLKLVWTTIGAILNAVSGGIATTINAIGIIFTVIKHVILLLGDGVWFIVIFIPKSILSLGPLVLYYSNQLSVQTFKYLQLKIQHVCESISNFVMNCFIFVTDVPVESAVGVVIAVCFVCIFLQFYSILKTYFRNAFTLLVVGLRLKYNQLKLIVMTRVSRQGQSRAAIMPNPRPNSSTSCENGKSDNRCIVCEDREKCILVLPCKHLCLCTECTTRVMYYTGRCPICRKPIVRTMKVFT